MRKLIIITVACAFTPIGCADHAPGESNARKAAMTNKSFVIGDTDFGINVDESSFEINNSNPAKPLLTIKVMGSGEVFEKLTAEEDSKWSWALDAPHFYIRDFPASPGDKVGDVSATASLDDIDEYELAIYMMEHSAIDDVKIQIKDSKALDITGKVDLFGEIHNFAIRWHK
jgi:hypothetical protein